MQYTCRKRLKAGMILFLHTARRIQLCMDYNSHRQNKRNATETPRINLMHDGNGDTNAWSEYYNL